MRILCAIELSHPILLIAGLSAMVAMAVIAWRRQLPLSRSTRTLAIIGAALLAIAAGGPTWTRPDPAAVVVMVDLSPSTRGAAYRDSNYLDKRLAQLLGTTPRRVIFFSDGISDRPAGN